MIEILGNNQGSEYETAKKLKRLFHDKWVDLASSQNDHIKIFVGLKMYGYEREDVDIIVVGYFEEPRTIDVEMKFYPKEGEPVFPSKVIVSNFVWVIEDKGHDSRGVDFEDKLVKVKYVINGIETWESATEQNRVQMFEFKKYVQRETGVRIRTNNLIHLSSMGENEITISRPHNVIGKDITINSIFNIIGQVSKPFIRNGVVNLKSADKEYFKEFIKSEKILNISSPTSLDRKKMDNICKISFNDLWLNDLGKKQILIKGRGGVGKTIILLQMAFKSWDQENKRSLFLTFNNALVADLRRTMSLLGVPKKLDGGIEIQTVHSFFKNILEDFSLLPDPENFLDFYEDKKNELMEFFKSGALDLKDFQSVVKKSPQKYLFDFIFIDEGQDWPNNEIYLLNFLYKANQIIVADGEDQYIRGEKAEWINYSSDIKQQTRKLRRCLRMKRNLAVFVSELAQSFDLNEWDLQPNDEASGGRIIIIEGNMSQNENVYIKFRDQAKELGNHPVDLLACVPPKLVVNHDNQKQSLVGKYLQTKNIKVWDGTNNIIRKQFCRDKDELRIVQYDSCRGLEGWTVFNYEMDEFWDYKFQSFNSQDLQSDDLYTTNEELVKLMTAKWMLIPLTRAIDTIVINISTKDSILKSKLKTLTSQLDFVEWETI